jgi:methionine synthase I (cobalamin-dependent)
VTFCDSLQEQAQWAGEGGADFIVGETFTEYGEAKMCLDAILKHGKGKNKLSIWGDPSHRIE